MTDSMRDAVAKVLYDEIRNHPDPLSWVTAEALAGVVIERMREPTEQMLAALGPPQSTNRIIGFAVWITCITAALSPSREDEGK